MTARVHNLKYRLDLVYPLERPEAVAAVKSVAEVLGRVGEHVEHIMLYDEAIDRERLTRSVANRGRPTFNLTFRTSAARLGRVRNHNHSFLQLDFQAERDWKTIVAALAELAPLVSARVAERRFDHWQNAFDPLQFRAAGRSMAGLPMKSNGLPYPLEQMVVDTSRNPGRRILRDGYVEAIGHRMWLGPEYFARVPGADRDAIVRADWLQVTELDNGLLELVAAEEPFTEDSPTDIQDRLRRLLFPTTA